MKNIVMLFALIGISAVFLVFWDSPPEFFFSSGKTRIQALPTADRYMRNPITCKFDKDGAETYTLRAETGLYYNDDDRFELDAPQLVSRRNAADSAPWQLEAHSAHTLEGGKQVLLSGDVHAWQNSAQGRNTFDTDELIFNPADNTAETDLKVTIHFPGGFTTGVGMKADFDAETYELLTQVQGKHHGL